MSDQRKPPIQPVSWTPPQYAFEAVCPGYDPPQDPTIPLWRYMDFTKFVSMLETRSIFFARADLLGDPFEGSLTRVEAKRRADFEAELRAAGRRIGLHQTAQPKIRGEIQNSIVSCWHMNAVESMAMWVGLLCYKSSESAQFLARAEKRQRTGNVAAVLSTKASSACWSL